MTAGRKTTKVEVLPAIDPSVDQEKLRHGQQAMAEQAQEQQSAVAEASRWVGAALMARVTKNFSAAAEVRMFENLRALSREILRQVPIPRPDGSATAETLAEMCPLIFARSYNTMAEEAQNLGVLGEPTYEAATRLGLSRAALRAVRSLPSGQIQAVQIAVNAGSSRAEVKSLIEDLAYRAERAEATVATAEAERDRWKAATETASAELADVKTRIKRESPGETLLALRKEAGEIGAAIDQSIGDLRVAVISLQNASEDREDQHLFLAGLIAQAQRRLLQVQEEFGLPDLLAATDGAEMTAEDLEALRVFEQRNLEAEAQANKAPGKTPGKKSKA